MGWDEGSAIFRARGIARWASGADFDSDTIARDWQYTTVREGHPALGGILIAAGAGICPQFVHPLTAARLGPIFLFSLAAGAMFYRMGRQFSTTAAIASVAAMLVMPRLLAHVHFATWDGPLVSCWILAWAAFPTDKRFSRRSAVLFGLALGMTLSAKATGWLAPLGFFAWSVAYRDRAGLVTLAVAVPIAVGVFVLLNPPLWHDPGGGMVEFLRLNLNRGDQPGLNISTQFLGRMYNLDFPLPWWNTLFWTAISVPLPVLLLAGVGLAVTLRHPRRRKVAMLLVANWLVPVVVRALPGTPPHDGIRLFLPSFAFLAALAGLGAEWLIVVAGRPLNSPLNKSKGWLGMSVAKPQVAENWGFATLIPSHPSQQVNLFQRTSSKQTIVVALLVLAYLGSATSVYWYRPQWLSYYNIAIGGLRGAASRGMEPTYYWDALDQSVLDWLHENTSVDEKIRFAAGPKHNLQLLGEWDLLAREYAPKSPGEYRWYVLQHRPSGLQACDNWLIANRRPVLRKELSRGGCWAWRGDVPLVEVYEYSDHQAALVAGAAR